MPTYVYEVIREDGTHGERFEIFQRISDEPLTKHPETGEDVRRVFVPFGIAGVHSPMRTERNLADDRKLERLGFTKYVKSDDGRYDKVVGKGPDQLNR